MANFNLGDNVYLKKGLYIPNEHNPTNTLGVIESYETGRDSHPYRVRWSNGQDNTYNKTDLILANKEAKPGDLIQVLNTVGAMWLRSGHEYLVEAVDPPNGKIKVGGQFWSCQSSDYTIVTSQAGESTFDKEALEKQQRRLLKENALQIAAKDYPAGTKFKSMQSGDVYTVADKPGYEWSENTEGIYLWGISPHGNDLRVYITKRGDWAEKITDEFDWETAAKRYKSKVQKHLLLQEAAERFPPGTRFTNVYGSTSVISDDPEYTNDGNYVYAKCVTGKRVTICVAGEWRNVISKAPPRPKLKAGDRIYIKRMVKHKGGVSEYAGRVMTIAYEPYWYGDGSYHITFTETPKRGFVVYPDEWEPATDTSKQIYDVRYGPESSTYEEFLDKYFYKNKNQINGTESSKQSVKLQGINLQIREGNSIRGIGLKSSGSKIKLGSDYRYN